jgi:hypothetical protein
MDSKGIIWSQLILIVIGVIVLFTIIFILVPRFIQLNDTTEDTAPCGSESAIPGSYCVQDGRLCITGNVMEGNGCPQEEKEAKLCCLVI